MTTAVKTTIHPVYARVAAMAPRYPMQWQDGKYLPLPGAAPYPQYLTTAEVARLLRERLKREFPGVKFRVRSAEYSGGSSIDLSWQGGPAQPTVAVIAAGYNFSDFDGMIDLKVGKKRWLLPDGSLTFAATLGTEGSGGVLPALKANAPVPAAILVAGGADFVFCRRDD